MSAMRGTITLGFEFTLDLAHFAAHEPRGHVNRGLHGHSYFVRLVFSGMPDPRSGYIIDADEVNAAIGAIKDKCFGRSMNSIDGMGYSMETLASWLAAEAYALGLTALAAVEVTRPSCGMSCRFEVERQDNATRGRLGRRAKLQSAQDQDAQRRCDQ